MLLSVSTPCLKFRKAFAASKTKIENLVRPALGRPKAGLADLEHFFQTSNLDFEATTNVKYISIHENYMSLPPVDSPDPKEQLSYV